MNILREKNKQKARNQQSVLAPPKIQTAVFVGVDAGGTKIGVTLINNKKVVLFSTEVPLPANPIKIKVKQAIANLISALEQIFEAAATPMQMMKSIVIGLAGVDDENFRKDVENQMFKVLSSITNSNIQVEVLTDSEIALQSVNEGEEALVIIAGTGSIVKGRNRKGRIVRADGWGHKFGDEGSAVWIGRKALERIFGAYDGRKKEASKLTEAILHYTGFSDVEKLVLYFYAPEETSNARIAELAKVVYQVAKTGDNVSRDILKRAGKKLACSALAVIRKLELTEAKFPVALVGSVFQAKEFVIEPLMNEIISFAKNAEFIEPKFKSSVIASFRALEKTECLVLKP
jgi:N-acetylglucosamine kinase-like BadF-type ATPase